MDYFGLIKPADDLKGGLDQRSQGHTVAPRKVMDFLTLAFSPFSHMQAI